MKACRSLSPTASQFATTISSISTVQVQKNHVLHLPDIPDDASKLRADALLPTTHGLQEERATCTDFRILEDFTRYSLLTTSVHSVALPATEEEKQEMLQICWSGDCKIYRDNGRYRTEWIVGWIVGEIWRGHPMCEDDPEDYSDGIGESWL